MQKKRSLLWHLFFPYLFIGLSFLLFTSWYGYRMLKRLHYERTETDLKAHARFLATLMIEPLIEKNEGKIQTLCTQSAADFSERITVISASGDVLADSEEPREKMENHSDRPEFLAAVAGRVGMFHHYSYTLKKDMMYVAVPIRSGPNFLAVVRTSTPIQVINRNILYSYYRIDLLAGIVLVLVLATSLWIFIRLKSAIRTLQDGVDRFSRGRFDHKIRIPRFSELNALAENLNQMAVHIQKLLDQVEQQKHELENVFSNMTEGILVTDSEENILKINRAAAQMFRLPDGPHQNRSIQETFRNIDLIRFIQKTLSGDQNKEETLHVLDPDERFLQVHGTPILDASGEKSGALIVLNDITRIARLEAIRKDFVANVSHELKTPITSIKGFVETLQDTALKDRKNAVRFLGIIADHVDRLNSIIDDLLDLSRMEQNENRKIALKRSEIYPVLKNAVSACRKRATLKHIRIELRCDKRIQAEINPPLLQQAVFNLVDNAVKYSESRTAVQVTCEKSNDQIRIQVIDQGCGISRKHLPRIFERFYRVDKARSRDIGGTGLGLSIVKHIVQAHGGEVSVESMVGRGSTFAIVF